MQQTAGGHVADQQPVLQRVARGEQEDDAHRQGKGAQIPSVMAVEGWEEADVAKKERYKKG